MKTAKKHTSSALPKDDTTERQIAQGTQCEKQALHLPASFDPKMYPHYNVQASIYSMLLSALNLSEHFEKFPGVEERQRKLEDLITAYLATCDPTKTG